MHQFFLSSASIRIRINWCERNSSEFLLFLLLLLLLHRGTMPARRTAAAAETIRNCLCRGVAAAITTRMLSPGMPQPRLPAFLFLLNQQQLSTAAVQQYRRPPAGLAYTNQPYRPWLVSTRATTTTTAEPNEQNCHRRRRLVRLHPRPPKPSPRSKVVTTVSHAVVNVSFHYYYAKVRSFVPIEFESAARCQGTSTVLLSHYLEFGIKGKAKMGV